MVGPRPMAPPLGEIQSREARGEWLVEPWRSPCSASSPGEASRECISPPKAGVPTGLGFGKAKKGSHGSHGTPYWGPRQRRVPKGIAGVQLGIQGLQGPMAPPPIPQGSFWLVLLVNLLTFWDWLASELATLFVILFHAIILHDYRFFFEVRQLYDYMTI